MGGWVASHVFVLVSGVCVCVFVYVRVGVCMCACACVYAHSKNYLSST